MQAHQIAAKQGDLQESKFLAICIELIQENLTDDRFVTPATVFFFLPISVGLTASRGLLFTLIMQRNKRVNDTLIP